MGKDLENWEFGLVRAVNWEFDQKKFENWESAPPCPPPVSNVDRTAVIALVRIVGTMTD